MIANDRNWAHRMTWAVVLLVALFGVTSFVAAADIPALLVGTWQGDIDIPGQPLGVIINIEMNEGGDLTATASIPAQGAFDLGLATALDTDVLRLGFVDIPASMELTVDPDTPMLAGSFQQAGMAFPYTATKLIEASDPGADLGPEADRSPGADHEPGASHGLDADRSPGADHEPGASHGLDADQVEAIRAIARRALEELAAPGVSIAVVQNGEVVMAEGFGLRDVEQGLPVTADTLFPIGSTTKAFTSAAFQMLVDEGTLAWDRPIKDIIPGFRLYDLFATEHVTPLDMALHRSGLPRHEMIWVYNPTLTGEAFVSALQHLKPADELRTSFIYSNLGYMVLGHLIEQTSDMPWEAFVSQRILQPLGMDATVVGHEAMQQTSDFAHAYTKEDGAYRLVPDRDLGSIAAAGAIASNANDMAKWLLFQLNQGRVGDQELISPFGMSFMHMPHQVVPGSSSRTIQLASYGIGWFIDSYRGHYRVHHGGNTIAFSADAAFLPHDGIGVAVLTNAPGNPLPSLVINHVLDLLLGLEPIDWIGDVQGLDELRQVVDHLQTSTAGQRVGTSPSLDLGEYAGLYKHPAYGHLTVDLAYDQLVVTYYDATFNLKHWHFDQFRGHPPDLPIDIPFFFEIDASGEIGSVRVSMEPTVDPIVFTRQADDRLQDHAYLQTFVGDYEFMGVVFEVTLNQGVLTLHVPGQAPYPLQPIREGQFNVRDHEGFGIHFTLDSDGHVIKALLIQPHGNLELDRVE